ncbi:hypothetical protein HYH02_005123 [Chlamydomonas schloesseri]|uniref:Uncharacterized protein n=1 Tax=Chlamydomonas schloesseri TaxID=2026947 RepID=A0A835WLD7_9CHLO|nr:hypothetical protein HYH02_005123 [Chlamydomonas schloesseri]|eukprot:KAG2449590.1 hypothetical protein HYH02_005123 [Chlamydomonas schloesseri]
MWLAWLARAAQSVHGAWKHFARRHSLARNGSRAPSDCGASLSPTISRSTSGNSLCSTGSFGRARDAKVSFEVDVVVCVSGDPNRSCSAPTPPSAASTALTASKTAPPSVIAKHITCAALTRQEPAKPARLVLPVASIAAAALCGGDGAGVEASGNDAAPAAACVPYKVLSSPRPMALGGNVLSGPRELDPPGLLRQQHFALLEAPPSRNTPTSSAAAVITMAAVPARQQQPAVPTLVMSTKERAAAEAADVRRVAVWRRAEMERAAAEDAARGKYPRNNTVLNYCWHRAVDTCTA